MKLLLLAVVVVGCGGSTGAPRAVEVVDDTTPAHRRCLPVVFPECHCVENCGLGSLQDDGSYAVNWVHFPEAPVRASVAPYCVGDECTDAFHPEGLSCESMCISMPGDPRCAARTDDDCY
jgi:hypothetical protein